MKEKLQNILTDIKFYFVLISLVSLTLCIKYLNLKNDYLEEKENLLQQSSTIDSLESEIFTKELETGSYQIMWGILEEVNKPLADSINLLVE